MEELLSNDRIIAYHRQKENYEPSPPNTLQFAYGDGRYVKTTLELFQADDELKLKILEELNEDFHRSDFTTLALLSSDLLAVLVMHLQNKHNMIRLLSSTAIVLVCQVKLGRDHIMDNDYVNDMMKLFDDHVEKIRYSAYQALLNLSEFQGGIDHILEAKVLPPLVDKLIEENVEEILIKGVLELITRALSGEQGQVEVLRTPAIKRLSGLLSHTNPQVRRLACLNLQAISFSERGKIEIIGAGCVMQLVARLKDDHESVIESASMVVASLAQRNEAKFEIIDNQKLPIIIELLEHPNEQIKLNTIQLMASMAEHPKGRQQLKVCLPTLKVLAGDPQYEYISFYAQQAIEVILWVP